MTHAHVIPDTPCYLDGQWLPLDRARVSVLDRGFLFGDAVYEAVPVYEGRLFRFHEHLARLARSLDKVRIPNPHDADTWLALARELVTRVSAHTGAHDQFLYLQVSRGVAMRDHQMIPDLVPTVFMMSQPMKTVSAELRHRGVACVTARDFRWERGDIKSTSLLGNVMARQMSADRGAHETILLREGEHGITWLTEASTANVWIAHEGALLGAPPGAHVLEGVRVELLRELCEEVGIGFHLRPITESELRAADEVLLSSAGREVLAVTTLDGEPVGHGAGRGRPGPVYARLHEAYQQAKRLHCI
jgi:D-alanine transaminase